MRVRELYNALRGACEGVYPEREATQIARIMVETLTGVKPIDLVLSPSTEVEVETLEQILKELSEARPMHYILGEAEFCSLNFMVREGVLIPRSETEELVGLVVKQCSGEERILDVGTGSGAIAISVAKSLPKSEVTAIDISHEALSIARTNGERLGAEVDFREGDALQGIENYVEGKFDVVVSNPPYIPASEEVAMRDNVTKYEPHLALFVDDCDPLIFYRAIAQSSLKLLRGSGRLYFEVHETLAGEVAQLLQEMGYCEVNIVKDINDKERIVWAQRS